MPYINGPRRTVLRYQCTTRLASTIQFDLRISIYNCSRTVDLPSQLLQDRLQLVMRQCYDVIRIPWRVKWLVVRELWRAGVAHVRHTEAVYLLRLSLPFFRISCWVSGPQIRIGDLVMLHDGLNNCLSPLASLCSFLAAGTKSGCCSGALRQFVANMVGPEPLPLLLDHACERVERTGRHYCHPESAHHPLSFNVGLTLFCPANSPGNDHVRKYAVHRAVVRVGPGSANFVQPAACPLCQVQRVVHGEVTAHCNGRLQSRDLMKSPGCLDAR